MRRNVRPQQPNWYDDNDDDDNDDNVNNEIDIDDMFARPAYDDDEFVDLFHLANRPSNGHAKLARFENTLEVNVQEGDTLQALALRFHCSVGDIKRLNKIDRENEIHARRVIRIPVTVHNVLLGNDALPGVHRNDNNSPLQYMQLEPAIERNPLEDARLMLDERMLVAAVNGIVDDQPSTSRAAQNRRSMYEGSHGSPDDSANMEKPLGDNAPLLNEMLIDRHVPIVRPIPGPSLRAIDWSGSDCDMSWICLLIFILALCVVIPLVYVIYLAEHPPHSHAPE